MKIYKYIQEFYYRFIVIIYTTICNAIILFNYKDQVAYLLGQHQTTLFPYFIATNLTEIFFSMLKLCFFLSLYLAYPVIILQLWFFIIPGLYKYEYKILQIFTLLTILLFGISTLLTYKVFLPYCWKFFSGFELKAESNLIGIHLETRLNEYLDFFIKGFLLLNFLFHIVLIFIIVLQKINLDLVILYRKIIYLILFILATIGTPPDIFSQLLTGIILISIIECLLIILFIFKSYDVKRASNGTRTRNFQSHNLAL